MTRTRAVLAAFVALVTLAATSCGGGDDAPEREASGIASLETDEVPPRVLTLDVAREDIDEALTLFRPSYVEAAALFSLRSDELVQATLQIAELGADQRYQTGAFRRVIVNQLGSTEPRTTEMGDQVVYRTTGTKQTVAVWFEGRKMYLLAIRDDFLEPISLIRMMVELPS